MSYHSGQDPEENLPDWLKDLRKRRAQLGDRDASTEGEPGHEPPEEEPDWLREIRTRYGRPEPEPEPATDQEAVSQLSDTQPVPSSRETAPAQEPELEPMESDTETSAFQWPSSEEHEGAEEILPTEEAEGSVQPQAESTRREFPDWLGASGEPVYEAQEFEDQEPLPHTPAFAEGTEELAPGEVPSWLEALRPAGVLPEEHARTSEMLPPAEGLSKETGPLAGLSGVLPAESVVFQPIKPPVYSARLELTDSQSQHVAAFKSLIDEEAMPKEIPARPAAKPGRWLTTLVGGALFLAILVPLINQDQTAGPPAEEILPESRVVFDSVEGLAPGAPVLLVFELQPALYGETKAASAAVLNHLLDKGARPVFISTQPTGPVLANELLQEVQTKRLSWATGDTIHLGYLSGGMAALRSFLSDPRSATFSATALSLNPWTNPILESVHRVSDFALVLVFTGSAEDARIWIEQGATEMPNGLFAVTSAQAAPLLQPYLQSQPQTLRGLVSGLQGAVFYESLRAQPAEGRRMWDAYSFGLGTIVILILLSAIFGSAFRVQPRTKAETTEKEAPGSRIAN